MSKKRRRFNCEIKAKVALEALKEHKTLNELAAEFSIHPNQISQWKRDLRENAPKLFGSGKTSIDPAILEKETAPLYEQIGRLKVELDWLKKKFTSLK